MYIVNNIWGNKIKLAIFSNKPPTDLSNKYHEALPVLQRPLADFSRLLSMD